ncbi:hypothetical protein L6452_01954 [Arctium lappa]|uniref:Uncharacterized protein n=1 Tax=Arctium lappa TaxID=4217 RepID=A0ACB9FIX1_ARCLA|nr:hypothetical protein L6452_01954 [Arctium lappa]
MLEDQVYSVDFVILCLGRFKDIPNVLEFPTGKGAEVFRGKVIHSMEYAAMDNDEAAELVKGKNVKVVVGFGKSGIARECSSINGYLWVSAFDTEERYNLFPMMGIVPTECLGNLHFTILTNYATAQLGDWALVCNDSNYSCISRL